MNSLHPEPLTAESFAPFGHVLEVGDTPDFMINGGRCGRYHDMARPEVTDGAGQVGLSVGRSDFIDLPLTLDLMERHPLGTQAFVPMDGARLLVVVAPDVGGRPGQPRAFLSNGAQGIQYHCNVWHGVLAPLQRPATVLIVDRVGDGNNLEEFPLPTPYIVQPVS